MTCRIVPLPNCDIRELSEHMAPGDLIESPYGHEALTDIWAFKCPQCEVMWSMRVPDTHQIVSRDPLTVTPSWLCPRGCHYFIRDGLVCV